MSKFQDLISKIAEKRPSRTKAKNLGKVAIEQALNRFQNRKHSTKNEVFH